jgi:hypothetical protein
MATEHQLIQAATNRLRFSGLGACRAQPRSHRSRTDRAPNGRPIQPTIGEHIIQTVHHVGLGHHRQLGQICQFEGRRIDPCQPLAVEGRAGNGMCEQSSRPVALTVCDGSKRRACVATLEEDSFGGRTRHR